MRRKGKRAARTIARKSRRVSNTAAVNQVQPPDPCQDLANLVAQLSGEVQALEKALADSSTPLAELPWLSGQLYQARNHLQAATSALQNCRNPPFPNRTYLKASNTGVGFAFGYSVAVSGDTIVIGSPFETSNATGVNGNQNDTSAAHAGAAYVFVREAGVWSQQAYLKASNTAAEQKFGCSVAVSGDTIVVGAYGESSNAQGVNGDQSNTLLGDAGAAYVFVRANGAWSQQAYLKPSNTRGAQFFGWSVAVSGDTIVVGSPSEGSNGTGVNGNQNDYSLVEAGSAYVFVRVAGVWSQQAYLKSLNTTNFQKFGSSVAVSDGTVVVGTPGDDLPSFGINTGSAYVFERTRFGPTVSWVQRRLTPNQPTPGQYFGYSVAVDDNTLVVGAQSDPTTGKGVNPHMAGSNAYDSGAAYVFVRQGPRIRPVRQLSSLASGAVVPFTWLQEAFIKPSNTAKFQYFGTSVSVSGDLVVVGAIGESSNAKGENGNQADTSAPDAGAAYAFVRTGIDWSQQAYLKASNTLNYQTFGCSVAVSNGTMVVGASAEDSGATGVDGNQSDNSVGYSGAAYVISS